MVRPCELNYGAAVKQSMEMFAQDFGTVFIGYNLIHGSRAYGSLVDVDSSKCLEMPVAENLMAGLATGLGLVEGYRPVLIFERQDFMLNALDSLVNHLDKLELMSGGSFVSPVTIRAIVGSANPIDPGPQHRQDFTEAFKRMFKIPIYDPKSAQEVLNSYRIVYASRKPAIIVDRRELHGQK